MGIRLTGLNSGMDTDSIVQALMSAQNYKKTKIEASQTKLEWKKELWGELNTKIYDFYTSILGKMRLQGTFKTKAATSTDNSKVTATASSTAAEGTYRIKVNSLASAQYVTSGKLNVKKDADGNDVKASNSTKLVDLLDGNGNQTFSEGTQIKVQGQNGVSTVLVDANTTISDFVAACGNAGLTATFDADQQRFFISSGKSGEDQGFTITSSQLTSAEQQTIADWREAVGYDYLSSTDQKAVNSIFDALQEGKMDVNTASSSLQTYVTKSQEAAVTAYYRNQLTDGYSSYFTTDATGNQTGVQGNWQQVLLDSGMIQSEIDGLTTSDQQVAALNNAVSILVSKDLSTPTYQTNITNGVANGIAGASSSFLQQSATDRATTIAAKAQSYQSDMSGVAEGDAGLAGLGLGKVDGSNVAEGSDASGMVVVAASDASITFNGATLTSSTSTLTVNGLTLNILDTTPNSEISISVTKDTSAIYDTVKDFISEYNDILKTMNSYYNAASAKDYDVLTDDQKEAMTDSEIEKWEDKIKSALLRRDDTLSSLISSFRTNMMGSYTASDGKRYSLASLGITTSSSNWYEGGLLHIKGDEDDSEYLDEDNKLEEMLTKDPELVMEILNGLAGNLYTDLQKKMQTTSMSSALTFYNDKEMNSQLSDYKKQIATWETKLAALEERYYNQFTAMEKAMASLNAQQNYFSSMMG